MPVGGTSGWSESQPRDARQRWTLGCGAPRVSGRRGTGSPGSARRQAATRLQSARPDRRAAPRVARSTPPGPGELSPAGVPVTVSLAQRIARTGGPVSAQCSVSRYDVSSREAGRLNRTRTVVEQSSASSVHHPAHQRRCPFGITRAWMVTGSQPAGRHLVIGAAHLSATDRSRSHERRTQVTDAIHHLRSTGFVSSPGRVAQPGLFSLSSLIWKADD